MAIEIQSHQPSLYETDYLQWIEITVEKLRQQDYAAIDWDNLIEEIADMGRSERKSLKSNVTIVLLHLLKWQYQPQFRSGSWKGSIVEHRQWIRDDLASSPSLKPYLHEIFSQCYIDATEQASAETGLPIASFPSESPYTLAQVLDAAFFPEG
ncbi:DUF29 domain-containing protein [Leptolyngbya sp. NK1-12]|uniref:DUF29 domain-containing protein n=1 Tax=Leptolyngbya sp. NK1-12 TaxID=2547451 RepID=A0AA96WHI2_9CYAN|nr:DUF29 domain-containing protein [Leptolyngbya sp. NK1-12]WNZ25224.1 DUF29 domain-containing protein [Leptolyngbya sp. NK1-12]